MTRALVTGGSGFIGSYLCDRLVKDGVSVVCVDNFATSSRENVGHIDSANFTLIEQDVSEGLKGIEGPFDYVLHFASPASPPDYLKMPIETLLVNSAGTHSALKLAHENNAVFLLASTSEVYGDPEQHPQTEGYWGNVNTIGPRGCYDEAKRYAEAAVMAYYREYKLAIRIVRIFNTFGPRMRPHDGRAVSNFVVQALSGDDITVYGDGSQTRSFCYATDLVNGILKLLRSDVTVPVNIGNPNELTILELAEMIIAYTGSNSKIVFEPLPEDDPKVRRPNISRAKEKLGWEPKVSFEDGLKKTIEYYKTLLAEQKITR
ncbi:UDP-glucuronate decarboxylase [hydrothermal vent metagenome]|uniref:UDP-glucuronate decarboxylase n=1 Tax=hydrothermal vent metagenome TaxID=652676 RepID=A0A3B1BAJ7_9ZZZZ